jgi:hypothetical protein
MVLDADCLYEARVENVERLAMALGVRLPPYRGSHVAYSRKLVRLVMKGLEKDARSSRSSRTRGQA